jgi:uncharacterized protein YyaL (SSP411 family)
LSASPRNVLAGEKSPYLLQHKDNPVPWQSWGEDAFRIAREQDKPIFLSIGYSTCYWCHVMERDSFEHEDVAALLAANFVSIKVDREELPDVDQLYMDAVVGIHGHGGWPMSVFLTPTGHPFWGGTFFYREQFKGILQNIAESWRSDRQKVLASSTQLTRYLERNNHVGRSAPIGGNVLHQAAEQLVARYDTEWGGFGGAPKFPPSQQLRVLLRAADESGSAAAHEASVGTLMRMALGGIFDHLGGGFHRYAVDEQWLVPHFEKMLYDNALLVPVYLEGYQLTGKKLLADTARAVLDYLVDDMCSPHGGFFTAEDAGEVGREGEFYVWTPPQIRAVCGEALGHAVCELFGVEGAGNFEHGTSVLSLTSEGHHQQLQEGELATALASLRNARATRVRPARDEKVLTGWNGLVVSALCKGYTVLREESYLEAAKRAARWLVATMGSGETLQRRFFAGSAGIDAKLEDYAYLIQGLLALYEASSQEEFLSHAVRLQDEQHQRLWSDEHSAYVTSAQAALIISQCEWDDGATPSPNGISLMNLLELSQFTGEERFEARLEMLLQGIPASVTSFPSAYPSTVLAVWSRRRGCATISVHTQQTKPHPGSEVWGLWSRFLPLVRVLWGASASKIKLQDGREGGAFSGDESPLFYPCKGRVCFEPTVDVEVALRLCSPSEQK